MARAGFSDGARGLLGIDGSAERCREAAQWRLIPHRMSKPKAVYAAMAVPSSIHSSLGSPTRRLTYDIKPSTLVRVELAFARLLSDRHLLERSSCTVRESQPASS